MGADIRSLIQVKEFGQWKTVTFDPIGGRNYDLFGLLASVRGNDCSYTIHNRGAPDDLKPRLQIDPDTDWLIFTVVEFVPTSYFGLGSHTFGYYDLKELKELLRCAKREGESTGGLQNLVRLMKATSYVQCCKPEEIRIVFGFNS